MRLSSESNNEFVYDFFITDYLGNVRAIISNENAQVDQVVLTMEVNRIEEEEDDFYNVSPARVTRPITMPNDNTYGYNSKSAELTSSKDAGQGPGRMIPVKQGDLIDLSTKYWFEDLAMEDNRLTIAQIVQSLALSLISSGGDVVDNIESLSNAYTNSQSMEYLALSNLVAEMFEDVDLSKPQAFMIYLSLNEKFVASKSPYSGFIQVTEANQLGVLVRDQLKMPLNGYFHVFLVNASSKPVNFDNMTVNVIKANVLQQMDYYPFGLMYQKQDVNSTNNLLWHHGKELQENEFAQQGKSIDLEDFGARMYDPVVARWWCVDPLAHVAQGWSPYRSFYCNPLRFVDPTGMLEDNYGLDKDGNITFLSKTEDTTDKLIVLDEKGAETDKSIEVEKGVLNKVEKSKDSNGTSYDFMKVGNDATATKLFEFVSENSRVEWSQVKYGTKSNYIATSHNPTSENGGVDLMYKLLKQGATVREHIHSHPQRETLSFGPSGFDPLDTYSGDRELGEWINKYYPKKEIKLKVYEVPLKKTD